jgi:hypothetical protein
MPTYQLSDGAICNANGEELLTNCTHNANAPAAKIRHHDAECIVRDSHAFYGFNVVKSRLLRCKEGIFVPRIVPLTKKLRPVPQCCSDEQACLIGSESAR